MRVGNHQTINASNTTVFGNHNTVTGNNNTVTGNNNSVTGNHNTVRGDHNSVTGKGNHWVGKHNHINGKEENSPSSIVVGNNNIQCGGNIVLNDVLHGGWSTRGVVIGCIGGSDTVVNMFDDDDSDEPKVTKKEKKEADLIFVECPLPTDLDTVVPDDAPDGTPACVVCTAKAPCCVMLPCMHKSLCCECGRKLAAEGTKQRGEVKCPLCQGVVERIAKVFE
jgi:hypothetical protein